MTSRLVIGGYTTTPDGACTGGLALASMGPQGLGTPVVVAEAADPSFLITSPDRRTVYAVLERDEGLVAAWRVGGHQWEPLGSQPTGGASPCHLALSPDGRHLVASNYASGSLAVHPVGPGGALGPRSDLVQHEGSGPVAGRQDGPHAHEAVFTPSGHVVSCDLGADAVISYRLDPDTGRLSEVSRLRLAPGTGPRHIAYAPDGSSAWVVSELASTVVVCAVDGPSLTFVRAMSARAPGATGENLTAEVLGSADGRRVYISNRGDDTLTRFDVTGAGRSLGYAGAVACGGHWPRFLGWGPGQRTLVVTNERSSTITTFDVDAGDGALTQRGVLSWQRPTCFALLD